MAENIAENLAAVLEIFIAHVVPERIVDNLQVVDVAFYKREFYFVLGVDFVVNQFAFCLERGGAPDTCQRILIRDQLCMLEVLS